MARQTRAQRRARRAQQGGSTDGAVAQQQQRARARQAPMRPAEPARARPTPRHIPGRGLLQFVSESWAELKKVEWPGQQQLIQGITVVLVACLIVGVYLYAADQVFRRVVQDVLLR